MKSKSLRRHYKTRQFKKRQKDLIYISAYELQPMSELIHSKHFKMRVLTPKLCSCFMCGNPRKFYKNGKNGKTFKELQSANDLEFGLEEFYQLAS